MSDLSSESMWTEFASLWPELQAIGTGSVVLAGGYGLFLKQTWLVAHPEVPTIVPLAQWPYPTSRGTKDFDFVIGVDLIASAEAQERILAALHKHGFEVKEKMWQFEKKFGESRSILVDIHAPPPPQGYAGVEVVQRRVKRKPSLGSKGIHGREDAEAVGFDLHPFRFESEGLPVTTPNPVTWCSMKLTAMRDQREKAADERRSSAERDGTRDLAKKHAQDVCRIVAMTTRDERDAVAEVLGAIRESPSFVQAVAIAAEYFHSEGWGSAVVEFAWAPDDLQLIRDTLAAWFK